MAISLSNRDLRVILQIDDALDEVSDEEYRSYLETLDESKLTFKPDARPTYFIMKKVLNYDMAGEVKNKHMRFNQEEAKVELTSGTSMNEEVRIALVGIEHPEGTDPGDLVFIKDKDGYASKQLIALLDAYGQVAHLYNARKLAGMKLDNVKKKSVPLQS